MHQKHKRNTALKTRFGCLLQPQPGNGVGLFSKEKISKEVSKLGKIRKEKGGK